MPLPRCSKHLIALHCIRFLNRHTPLPSLFKSHCCPLIKMCSPSSVDKKSIFPLPFIATDESFTFGGEKGPMDIVFPGLREPWVAFSFAKGTSAPGQKAPQRLCRPSPVEQSLTPEPCQPLWLSAPFCLAFPCYHYREPEAAHLQSFLCSGNPKPYTNLPRA